MEKVRLGNRLTAAASFCRRGRFIADVGTDHAYLPIWLWEKGMIRGGVVSDVNEGPIMRARAHIKECGAERALATELCDGLSSLEGYAPEDIFILGMGGELIARIIDGGAFTKKEGVRLVLQPMTHAHDLRRDLYANGYHIIDETLIKDRNRVYQIIAAEYDGTVTSATEIELWLGKKNIERGGEDLKELALLYASGLEKKIKGYAEAGKTDEATNELYAELKKLAESVN